MHASCPGSTPVLHGMQKHDSASKQDKVQLWEEQRPVSKYALGLHQEPSAGKTIPSDPSQWACAETGIKENLWVNLSTGVIGSGREASLTTVQSTIVLTNLMRSIPSARLLLAMHC